MGTHNKGKVEEIRLLLKGLPLHVCSLSDFPDVTMVEETGLTYEENSKLKALSYASATKIATLADDSGLEVDALGGLPGVKSARFGGALASDEDRIHALLARLDGVPDELRTARFVCCLTLAGLRENDKSQGTEPSVFSVTRGEVEGRIAMSPEGRHGFGYDPIFIPDGYSESMAALSPKIKNLISHRARALASMKFNIESWIRQT